MSEHSTGSVLELVVQLAALQRQLTPALPDISKKLVTDLLASGCPARSVAKVIGRSPTYVYAVQNGKKSLSAQGIVDLCQYAATSQKRLEEGLANDAAQD